jgi:hypothetical protein
MVKLDYFEKFVYVIGVSERVWSVVKRANGGRSDLSVYCHSKSGINMQGCI